MDLKKDEEQFALGCVGDVVSFEILQFTCPNKCNIFAEFSFFEKKIFKNLF